MAAQERVVIVVPGDDPPQIQGSPHLDRLKPWGEVQLYTDRPKSVDEQLARAKDAVCLVNTRGAVKWPADALRALPKLRMATVCGIGTDAFDLVVAQELGIVVCNIPGRTAPIVAEHAFGLMLAVAKRAYFQTASLKAGRWPRLDNVYLNGKTLGLVGTGNIGGMMARLARAIGMDIVAWTFNPSAERAAALNLLFLPLDEMLATADVVSVHVRLSPQSRGLIGARELGLMKRGSILINASRGAMVDSAALVDALNAGHLAGAGLDVFDQEPLPPDHPILRCEHVVLTPHNADQTPEGMDILNEGVVDNVIAFLKGRPQNVVTA
jgi:phosphoglycerate dehydrogenase-like enzyme